MSDDLVKRLRETTNVFQADCELKMKCAAYIEQLVVTNEELEAKLAKAVEALKKLHRRQDTLDTFDAVVDEIVSTTLAELKGQDDE